jgi:DNA repair exonuclease SbcCD ATPase subunit
MSKKIKITKEQYLKIIKNKIHNKLNENENDVKSKPKRLSSNVSRKTHDVMSFLKDKYLSFGSKKTDIKSNRLVIRKKVNELRELRYNYEDIFEPFINDFEELYNDYYKIGTKTVFIPFVKGVDALIKQYELKNFIDIFNSVVVDNNNYYYTVLNENKLDLNESKMPKGEEDYSIYFIELNNLFVGLQTKIQSGIKGMDKEYKLIVNYLENYNDEDFLKFIEGLRKESIKVGKILEISKQQGVFYFKEKAKINIDNLVKKPLYKLYDYYYRGVNLNSILKAFNNIDSNKEYDNNRFKIDFNNFILEKYNGIRSKAGIEPLSIEDIDNKEDDDNEKDLKNNTNKSNKTNEFIEVDEDKQEEIKNKEQNIEKLKNNIKTIDVQIIKLNTLMEENKIDIEELTDTIDEYKKKNDNIKNIADDLKNKKTELENTYAKFKSSNVTTRNLKFKKNYEDLVAKIELYSDEYEKNIDNINKIFSEITTKKKSNATYKKTIINLKTKIVSEKEKIEDSKIELEKYKKEPVKKKTVRNPDYVDPSTVTPPSTPPPASASTSDSGSSSSSTSTNNTPIPPSPIY